jgi:hypothetical protein
MSVLAHAPVVSLAFESLIVRALERATELLHPVYDCIYLALALHYDTYVVTDDRRFATAADRPNLSGRVRLLGLTANLHTSAEALIISPQAQSAAEMVLNAGGDGASGHDADEVSTILG